MRTKNIHVMGMLIGSCFIAGVAGAMPAIPGQPPAGTPAALPSGPVPAPEPSPTAPPTERSGDGLLNLDLEAASACSSSWLCVVVAGWIARLRASPMFATW